MKQFTMVLALAAFSLGLQAQEYNLFDNLKLADYSIVSL